MNIKELISKPIKELQKILAIQKEKLRELRFKDTNKQLKNVRDIRLIKKTIAKILTLLNKEQ